MNVAESSNDDTSVNGNPAEVCSKRDLFYQNEIILETNQQVNQVENRSEIPKDNDDLSNKPSPTRVRTLCFSLFLFTSRYLF